MRKDKHEPEHEPKQEIEVKLRAEDRAELLRRLGRLGARPLGGRVHEMNVLYDTLRRDLLRQGEALRVRTERPAPLQAHRPPLAKRAPATKPRRLRSRGSGTSEAVTLTYKGPARPARNVSRPAARVAARYKIRTEDELRVSAVEPLAAILRASGLQPSFRYEKYRQIFRLPHLPGLVIDLDETPIGIFVELEGSPAAIDRAAARLGYGPADYITKGYPRLYTEWRQGRQRAKKGTPRTKGRASADALMPADAMLFPRPRRPQSRRAVSGRGY